MLPLLALGLAAAPAIAQGIKGIQQKRQARKLKVSNFVPSELLMNKDLAAQQAYSRRAPGQAFAESQVRRAQANQIGAAQRSFGGDANKIAAATSAATAQANDANSLLAARGQAFSEGAFDRMAGANLQIAGQKRQNQSDYNNQYNQLNTAGDTNLFNGINNLASAGITAIGAKQDGTSFSAQQSANEQARIDAQIKKELLRRSKNMSTWNYGNYGNA